ncbi:hypothetical protein ACA910_021765 [Epithemia clementina (nom. ined.)]
MMEQRQGSLWLVSSTTTTTLLSSWPWSLSESHNNTVGVEEAFQTIVTALYDHYSEQPEEEEEDDDNNNNNNNNNNNSDSEDEEPELSRMRASSRDSCCATSSRNGECRIISAPLQYFP